MTRRGFLRSGGLLGLGAFLGLPSCEALFPLGSEPPKPQLTFERLGSGCTSASEDQASLQGGPGVISFFGEVITRNPCYDLLAELHATRCGSGERCPNAFEVAITAEAQEGNCVECLGGISYRGELRGLTQGSYTIVITHDGRPIAEKQVHLT